MKRGRRRDKIPPKEIREAFELYLDGTTQKEIAKRLTLSTSTIQFHITNVLSKLGVSKRTEAIYLALKQKLVKLPGS